MKVLIFIAHPDDETLFMGGTLALLGVQGAELHYLCATRGEGGEVGKPPVTTQDKLGEVREQELLCAVQAIGGVRSLTFLGYTDPRVGPDDELYPFADDLTILAGQVGTSIEQIKPDVVLSHGINGEYGHPAHVLCHQAMLAAVAAIPEDQRPLFYAPMAIYDGHPKPRLANKDTPAHLVLDIRAVRTNKEAAAKCHKTQHALFIRMASKDKGRKVTLPESILLEESLHRVSPKVRTGENVEDALTEILAEWVVTKQ